MRKKLFPQLVALILFFSLCLQVIAVNAAPQEDISETRKQYEQVNDKIKGIDSQIATLNGEIEKLNTTLKKNNDEISNTETQIKTTKEKLEQSKKELDKTQSILGKRLRSMYKSDNDTNYIAVLLGSANFTDFISRLNALQKVVSIDNKLINELNSKRETLNRNIEDLNKKSDSLKTLKESTEADLKELTVKKTEQENILKEFNKEKEAIASLIQANEESLVSHSLSVINSQSSSIGQIRDAINNLKSLLPQITTSSVRKKVQTSISNANSKLASLNAYASLISRGNEPNSSDFKATYSMSSTAYTGHSLTSLGIRPVRDPSGLSTIAVDPSVIPLGSKVYVQGYGYAIAADTGGAIKGNIVDVFFNSNSECNSWGRKKVTVHVVAYPGQW